MFYNRNVEKRIRHRASSLFIILIIYKFFVEENEDSDDIEATYVISIAVHYSNAKAVGLAISFSFKLKIFYYQIANYISL